MKKLDCFGDFCPVPLLKAQKEVTQLNSGESFMLVTDHSCVVESIDDHFHTSKYNIDVFEAINGVWEITIKKL